MSSNSVFEIEDDTNEFCEGVIELESESSSTSSGNNFGRKRQKTSGIWSRYVCTTNRQGKTVLAICKTCNAKFKNPSGTSTLRYHYRKHEESCNRELHLLQIVT